MADDVRYPIGKFQPKEKYSLDEIKLLIEEIATLPEQLEKVVSKLSSNQLDTPYREGGWTLRQVVHHLPDSHMNAYVRMKWTLTEETPLIKAYDEKAWAETPETKLGPQLSIDFLKALHTKWVALMKTFDDTTLQREFTHPETGKRQRLDRVIAMYAWHGAHHLAHITSLIRQKGW